MKLIQAKVLSTLRYDGAHHGPNAVIGMTEADFEEKKAEGMVSAVPAKREVERPAGEALLDAIINAMPGLGEDDFSADGKPKVKPLEARLGFNIDAAHRDEALVRLAGIIGA